MPLPASPAALSARPARARHRHRSPRRSPSRRRRRHRRRPPEPMRLVVQRVTRAAVRSGGELLGEIGAGAAVLVGISAGDDPDTVDRMADKLVGLRYFEDDAGRTNLSIGEGGGAFLVVSQFTLYAEPRRGRRPGLTHAAAPDGAGPRGGRVRGSPP